MSEHDDLRAQMEATIRRYFDGCNEADRDKMVGCMTADAVHYFPAGSPFGAFRGAEAIARGWQECVEKLGSSWTVDRVCADPVTHEAVIEWTHWKSKQKAYLRGAEWYRFDEQGRITEIRAYYAAPAHAGVAEHELGGFDYVGREYPMGPPPVAGRPPEAR